VYLGVWEVNLEDSVATVHRWRAERSDLEAVIRAVDPVQGGIRIVDTPARAVTCAPYRLATTSQRQVC
jgi:hypothetical protein